jgi:hypothetical protein
MTEVDNQDAAGADVCKIVGLAFRCERKATDKILKDLKQLRGGAVGTHARIQRSTVLSSTGVHRPSAAMRGCCARRS